jgi:hypothetical protein
MSYYTGRFLRNKHQDFVVDDIEDEEEKEKENPRLEPLVKSVQKLRKSANKKEPHSSKVHDYEINSMLDYLPGELQSFRDRKRSHQGGERNRYKDLMTPKSAILQKEIASCCSALSNNSARKTVRFAESSQGLLRSVPVEPSFNDSDFVYEMRHNF